MAKNKSNTDFIIEADGFATITLARPEKVNGVQQAELRMREPTVGDWKIINNFKGSEADKEILGIANLCDCSPKCVEGFSLRNMARAQAAFALFTS